MRISITLNERDFTQTRQRTRQLPLSVARAFGEAAFVGAEVVERKLRALTPYDVNRSASKVGSHLRDNIATYVRPYTIFGRRVTRGQAVVGVWEGHAHFVEFGTVTQAPQGFMRRAVQSSAAQVDSAIKTYLSSTLRSLGRRI